MRLASSLRTGRNTVQTVEEMNRYIQSRTTDELKLEFLMYKDTADIFVELLAIEINKRKQYESSTRNN